MSGWTKVDKRSIIDRVFLNIPKISDAPKSVADLPGFHSEDEDQDGELERAITEDANRIYKSVDTHGNIFLMRNPWSCKRFVTTVNGRVAHVELSKPRMALTYEQALDTAKRTKVNTPIQQIEAAL